MLDSAYISVAGIWAASCNEANIHLVQPYNAGADDGSNLVITGGTIFNAGAMPSSGCPKRPWTPQPQSCVGKAHGIVVDYGYLTMNGVDVRYNSGTAVIGAVHVILCLLMQSFDELTLRCGVTIIVGPAAQFVSTHSDTSTSKSAFE